jgi:hypothetical protein
MLGKVERVVLHPLTILRTDLAENPSPLVVVLDAIFVATFVAVTVTPGRRPPELSVIRPVMPPRKSCALAVAMMVANSTTARKHTRLIHALPSTPPPEVTQTGRHPNTSLRCREHDTLTLK